MDVVTSTQDEAARRLAAGEAAPFAVLAREQTAGRGRLGRRFASPAGVGVALTVSLRTTLPMEGRTWIPLAAGLAVIDVLAAPPARIVPVGPGGGGAVGLKWPNDIHTVDGRKLGGILVEGRGLDHVMVGIGLNLTGPVRDIDGDEVPQAAWLYGPGSVTGRSMTGPQAESARRGLAADLAWAVQREVGILESAGGDARASGTHQRYTVTCLTLGRAVRVEPLGEPSAQEAHSCLRGTARRIDSSGRLVLRTSAGTDLPVDVGDVRHGPRDDR
nr:biotin--[acetyl-CoA-carboxylase] ligase [Brachybacterium muris]